MSNQTKQSKTSIPDEFAARIGDAGRGLMAPLKGYTSLLRDAVPSDSKERAWIEKLINTTEKLEACFAQLEMCHIDRRGRPESFHWADSIRRVVESLEFGNDMSVDFRVEHCPSAPIVQHRSIVERVLFQLMRNAMEAAGGNGLVTIKVIDELVGTPAAPLQRFVVTIRDDGHGVPGKYSQEIWKPHFSTRTEHLGLGLPYVSDAAGFIDMDVYMQSRENVGTDVTLVIKDLGGQTHE